ncbi:hypothetical protein MD484_g8672, partial [Candolleomyces efflorescens]
MATNATFFPGVSHSSFDGLQINVSPYSQPLVIDPALKILHRYRALEATHTSKTASSAPKCKPGTRIKAIEDIMNWANETDLPIGSSMEVLWFRGPAGAGKSCIMREVTRRCHKMGKLVGDYFFSTRVPGLDNESPFIATIVSHLIEAIPALDHPVRQTIQSNPTIFEHSLEFQIEKLVSKHTTFIQQQIPAPRILVIDGFDECRDIKQRAHLLQLIHSLATPPHSFRVIIASRPELDIRTAFDRPPLKSLTKILHLENYEASGEIYQFLYDEFTRIRESHPAKQSIPAEWPGEATLHALTDKSSGGYIYPSVVIKYVDNPRRHPVELLRHVLNASSAASSIRPFAELDALYDIILNPPEVDIPLMKRLLHLIIEITRTGPEFGAQLLSQDRLAATSLDEFLSLENGTTEITLCDLHSVLSVANVERPWIYFHHKSLEDYLCSPERGGKLYQSQADTHSDLLTVCIRNLERWNRKLVSQTASPVPIDESGALLYLDARIVWSFHDNMCKDRSECWRSCVSFKRTLEYWDLFSQIAIKNRPSNLTTEMERLEEFEENCKGLFTPLDLSPPMGVKTTTAKDDGSALLHVPPPNTLLESSGSGDAVRYEQLMLESIATEEELPHTGTMIRAQPVERPRRWYHIL